MSRTLYNEGRVVGLSAYEIFVRHVLGADPTATVPTEQEWLASMLSDGSSMLLQIGADAVEGSHYIEIELPATSTLWTANTIVGSFFLGEGAAASAATGWCTRVTDYGPLIQNDASASPSADGTTIPPTSTSVDISSTTRAQLVEYTKIIDGVVIQPGTWSANTTTPPQKGLTPDVSGTPKLRILLSDKIDTPFYVLFTGFTYKGILNNVMDYTTFNTHPENGDFLGPVSFPWANKITFSVPSAVLADFQAVSVRVADLAGMYIYNTKYLWLYKNPSDSDTGLTTQDLEDVKTFNGVQVIAGYVSQHFIDTYCVSYAEALAAGANGKIGDSLQFQIRYVEQMADTYGVQIASEQYKYVFQKSTSTINGTSQSGHFWPVELSTGRIILTLSSAEGGAPTMNLPHGFNFSGSDITVGTATIPSADTALLGSYWNRTPNADGKTCDYPPAFTNHPMQKIAIKEYTLFAKPEAGVPLPPQKYGYDFTTWLSATPIKQALGGNNTTGENILNGMGVHADYQDLDALTFFQYAMTERNLTLPITTDYSSAAVVKSFYLFTKTDILAIINQSDWVGHSYTATERFKAEFYKSDFFKPAKMTALDSNNTDITKQLTDSGYHLWAAQTNVNRDSVLALSVTDGFGGLLPMGGTQGTISGDNINWDMISSSLNQNKSIDILGDTLREMKYSSNYIPLANGLRLYVSSTEPVAAAGDTIPEGSVGLGWAGVKVYTSGAWV